MRKLILAAALAATAAPAMLMSQPVAAQSWHGDRHDGRDARDDRRNARENRHDDRRAERQDRRDDRHDQRDYRHDQRAEWRHNNRDDRHDRRDDRHDRRAEWRQYNRYDWNRPDPRYGARYDAARYYRDDRGYGERRLSRNDRIYRGNDGRYYCRRSDGTTGLIIGALAGGLLGNALDNGRSSSLGILIGAGGGALIGRSIDRGEARCR